ncbi:uncharacterized protein LOC110446906 [Mizuhopecten yessoensis]|uniref:uncharacterized protein LOC110446906 n=1 Tax=Mizuhopecten yessoensis TaxID=6573 RepID=UPI000B45D664|nr:uncharacterized protein LOC110446906 [Mizuhopecten yessoensis]
MAMSGGGFRDEEEIDENYVTQIQALIRGHLTRRNLQLVKEEYEQIFSEIEGNQNIFVCWPLDTLCLPKIQKDRPAKKVSHKTFILDNHTPPGKDKTCLHEKIVSSVQDDNLDLSSQKENIFQEKCTAETQTSFIEDLNLKLSLGSSLLSQNTNTSDEERRTPVQDNMYTSSREESFTDQSGADGDPHLVQQTADDSALRQIHPSFPYNDKTGLPHKSPDSSEGFEHSGKHSVSHSSSGRSEVKSSRISPEITEVIRPAVNSKMLEVDYDRSRDSSRSRENSYRSEVTSDRSNVSSDRSRVKSDRSEVKSNRSNVSSDRSGVKSDRSEVKSNRTNVNSGRSGVKSDRSEARSDRSEVKSNRSNVSFGRSELKSDRSDARSNKSTVSRRSEVSPHSDRRERDDSMDEELSPASMTPRRYMRESSVLTNATSVWDSFSSATDYIPGNNPETITDDPDTLMEMRKSVSMELLWVQQAINSRKNYLKIKDQMKIPVSTT